MNENFTGRPSIDRPWMKYYPEAMRNMEIPECTLREYLEANCRGWDLTAVHYYGTDISWNTLFENVDAVARSLKALGIRENDQIPVFLRSVPEFIYLLLAAEKIGASLLCRDNTLMENVEAVAKSGARVIIAHDFLRQHELEAYLAGSSVEKVVLLDPCHSGNYEKMPPHVFSHFVKCSLSLDSGDHEDMPEYIRKSLDSHYGRSPARGPATMTWDEFLAAGNQHFGQVAASPNINRPLLRAYTSGSTGPSKQVIHSAHTMIGVIHQMNFYASSDDFRTTWLLTILPPALIAVVVSMILMPLSSNRILILDPFCEPEDVDLEMMRYRPNAWPIIPMFIDTVMKNGRLPDDYDMSHLLASGVGCESYNNKQIRNAQKFLNSYNCDVTFTVGYGCSEAGSNVTIPVISRMFSDGNVGIPLPKTVISIFRPGTEEELTYNQQGEICISGPGLMLGYDTPEATAKALWRHKDGRIWLHTGDIGYMAEDGNLHTLTRGKAPRFGGGDLATLPMENLVADANIEGIDDEFFVVVPDEEHPGYFLPYMYVMLEDGYEVADVEMKIRKCLRPHMQPVEIIQLKERPFFHFKTNRLGLQKDIVSKRQAARGTEEEKYA
ncbi:MAG: class I adenylate-forming enzyme family protein [Lentihominibacter sp.]|nr:class I adenylate-forming enzyme family protein [Lentihominibacter sp.]